MKRRRLGVLVTSIVFGLVTAGLLLAFLMKTPREPIYEGKTLSQWLRSSDFERARGRVDFALLALGQEALPVLRRHLRHGSKPERWAYQAAPLWLRSRWPSGRWSLYEDRRRALMAVEALGRQAQPLTPELLAIVSDGSEFPDLRREAMELFLAVGNQPSMLLPVLDNLARDSDTTIRQKAGFFASHLRKGMEASSARKAIDEIQASQASSNTLPLSEVKPLSERLTLAPVTEKPDPTNGLGPFQSTARLR